jgi:hypothetical protein
MADEREQWDEGEWEALRTWGAGWAPPEGLREQTRAALHERGLLGTHARVSRSASKRWIAAAAAAVTLAFVGGLAVGRSSAPVPPSPSPSAATQPPTPTGDLYMLLLYESGAYRSPSTPEEMRARVGEYGNWARATATTGRFVDGNELAGEGRWCRPASRGLEVAAPVLDPERGKLTGYFLIEATSYDDALAVTRGCPHLRHGGTVEVRRVGSG